MSRPLRVSTLITLITVIQCYIQSENPKECRPLSDDYLECLHKTKEASRNALTVFQISYRSLYPSMDGNIQIAHAKAVQDEFIRRAQAVGTESRKAADILAEGAIVGVGLIQRGEQDSKKH